MNNKCYAKFMADVVPLVEALLKCEENAKAHTPPGQLISSPSPIHQTRSGKWYFWDETWADRQGPYPTEKAAREALSKYQPYHGGGPEGHMLEETADFKGCMAEKLAGSKPGNRYQATPSGQRLHPVVEALQDFEAEHPCELKNRQKCKKLVPFECKFCNLVFPEWEDLKRHVVEKHPRHKLPKIGG